MYKVRVKTLAFSGALLLSGMGMVYAAEGIPDFTLEEPKGAKVDSILASVNGTPISLTDVLYESGRDEARQYAVYSGKDIYKKIKAIRKKFLDKIIARKLIIAEYNEKKPFEIPRQYVETLLDELTINFGCSNREELAEKAKKSGTSMADLTKKAKEKIILSIMVNSYIFSHVNLTPREIYEYYEKHKKEFSTQAAIRLQLMLLPAKRKNLKKITELLQKELKSGSKKVFSSMTRLYSSGPNAIEGGDLGWIEFDQLRTEFFKAVKGVPCGKVAGPVKTDEGVYFLRVESRREAETTSFNKLVPVIKKRIEGKRKKAAYDDYINELRKKAIIRYYI
ncbi:peptidyl-prolyl cis-trans isomerase [Lentisphaerota bacterium ZTH]|nr:peptidyl-prolyl cis-trans isomerase [Lentisphaerota bacterium]WET07139.1 peptidyl-prolyl cis-trans isomerase [Lentisphaerota bacterium ZTH]